MSYRDQLLSEANKCVYCGFCESVCPTQPFGPHRGYGPRGRVTLLRELLEGRASLSDEVLSSFYSCLLCNACSTVCPARIRVGDLMRMARAMLWGSPVISSNAAVRTR
ncbi:predicted Fe-S oxidoreductase [Acidilobus saccharovorans 345-15]|uniref:Predicted Fe-S oxidoreductase n=1 Tax=Acidilobus saccharovorans (strain DSM 16705 / JCM 18335 / VKM B-2471 / 345-15) TaxID=666510 RepID=D9Q0K3_ACIS3|nr:(Fe-S)-binding protein [Acidilobus saccharovorans]ADL18841.1 predicted Fe-S oxidoreductase [Acidilobus saccharovorans 345-15]